MAELESSVSKKATALRARKLIAGGLSTVVLLLVVAVSLYRLLAGSLTSVEVTGEAASVALAFGLGMPLIAWTLMRRTSLVLVLLTQGGMGVVWIFLLIGSFVGEERTMGLVGALLVAAYYLILTAAHIGFAFTVSRTHKSMYGAMSLLAAGMTVGAAVVDMAVARAVMTVIGLVGIGAVCTVVSFLDRRNELAAAQALTTDGRIAANMQMWSGMFYMGCAVFAIPLTLVAGRVVAFDNISLASYVIAAVSLALLVVTIVAGRLKWVSARTFAGLAAGNMAVAIAAYLLTNQSTVFLNSVDSMFIIGVYMLVFFIAVVAFAPVVAPTSGLLIARTVASWLACASFGVAAVVVAARLENAMALSFMPLDTFLVTMAVVSLAPVIFAAAVGLIDANAARRASSAPIADPAAEARRRQAEG